MDQGTASVRVAFWNTWLLRPLLWPGGPGVPFGDRLFAPDVHRRAPLVGAAVQDRFDVAALSECFEDSEQEAVAAAWPEATAVIGPGRRRHRFTGSGLMTLAAPAVTVLRTARHAYLSGGDRRDSDTLATKGALLTRIRLGDDAPALDVVSTHLLAGGELLPIPGHDDTVRHHAARMAQVDELVSFIRRERRADTPVLLLGDFNVRAHDPEPSLERPTDRYQDLAGRLAPLGFSDLWDSQGVGPGSTCTFTRAADIPPEVADPDLVVDDPEAGATTAPGERIDHLWLAPAADGSIEVAADRPRRWAFPGRPARGGPAGSLSDHLALSVTLTLRPPAP